MINMFTEFCGKVGEQLYQGQEKEMTSHEDFFFLPVYLFIFFLQSKIHIFKRNYIHTDYYIMDLKKQIK